MSLAIISDNAVTIAMTSRNNEIFALIELCYRVMTYKKCVYHYNNKILIT